MSGQELACFEEVYEQYQPLIYGTLKKYAIYQHQEELLQEARLALWEAYAQFDPKRGPFAAYASKYVRGRVLRQLTIQNRHKHCYAFSQLVNEDEAGEWEWPDEEAEAAYLSCELAELLEEAAKRLSRRESLILKEHLIGDRPLQELAQREQVSIETVKTWKKRALKKLRASLSPYLG